MPIRGAKLLYLVGASVRGTPDVARKYESGRRSRVNAGLLAENKGLKLIVLFGPRVRSRPNAAHSSELDSAAFASYLERTCPMYLFRL